MVEITLLDGTVYTEEITNYNAEELSALINAQEKIVVAIGDIIVNRHNIKSIVEK
jgi:hypothetical protein